MATRVCIGFLNVSVEMLTNGYKSLSIGYKIQSWPCAYYPFLQVLEFELGWVKHGDRGWQCVFHPFAQVLGYVLVWVGMVTRCWSCASHPFAPNLWFCVCICGKWWIEVDHSPLILFPKSWALFFDGWGWLVEVDLAPLSPLSKYCVRVRRICVRFSFVATC